MGGKVIVLCAADTTVGTTTQLFADAAKQSGAETEVRLVQGAWHLFRNNSTATTRCMIRLLSDE